MTQINEASGVTDYMRNLGKPTTYTALRVPSRTSIRRREMKKGVRQESAIWLHLATMRDSTSSDWSWVNIQSAAGYNSIGTNSDGAGNMRKHPLDMENLPLYEELLVTVIQSRMTMDIASARADILLNIFLITLENLGTEESFVKRTINHVEINLLDDRDAPEQLRDATADMARAIWASRINPTRTANQTVREVFERWESVYRQTIGELPVETYMDIENARCLTDADYYSKPPLPFVSRARAKVGSQN